MGLSSILLGGTLPLPQLALLAVGVWVCFHLARGIHQAYFHPLSRVPGPKLWDLRHFHRLHGPAVRYTADAVLFTTAPNKQLDPQSNILMATRCIPFRTGPRNRIGKHLAHNEMRTIMGAVALGV
ncbi:hypothetical protein C8035_v000162 [Colletotrichum spinosum]|uniref:Uncharacterized protein n=1 Tax=Colletotrichum spinosum TaxID=1347390 RepID=A0A4R8PLJ1_9PEZI|nr:hypothetical protein C8035_v000162 [Colletotrichum spinosum]